MICEQRDRFKCSTVKGLKSCRTVPPESHERLEKSNSEKLHALTYIIMVISESRWEFENYSLLSASLLFSSFLFSLRTWKPAPLSSLSLSLSLDPMAHLRQGLRKPAPLSLLSLLLLFSLLEPTVTRPRLMANPPYISLCSLSVCLSAQCFVCALSLLSSLPFPLLVGRTTHTHREREREQREQRERVCCCTHGYL